MKHAVSTLIRIFTDVTARLPVKPPMFGADKAFKISFSKTIR
jgi:hypothetical protein